MISYIWLWIIWLWIDSDTQPMRVIHWYSDTQINGGYSLVLWYPNQWGLFIGTLVPSQWGLCIGILILKPMGVIHWYSDTKTNGGYSLVLWCPVTGIQRDHSHKIVKNMNYVWVFELIWVFKTAYVFLEPIVSYSFWYMKKNWLLPKPSMIYL